MVREAITDATLGHLSHTVPQQQDPSPLSRLAEMILEGMLRAYSCWLLGNKLKLEIIIGRAKFSFVEGVLEKLRAIETLLQDYPEWIHNVVLIQVTSRLSSVSTENTETLTSSH
ncbi:hypothetical protein HGRIS_011482 [Hohenbuehelia grisea]|uniref:Uncharacterized protein n=1 Tax=Hohenbuehelia grisea TaxID=104357 RepID=A0ABR3JWY7_9AGAR